MESRTQERVEQWDSRQFSDGYDGLSDLADSGFSGAVTTGATWLFMLNGRIVGVFDGDIEAFEGASGTIYQAPHPSLPLLCSMEERGGDTRAKYYTNETPLREVDQTLQDGSFTGYVELSENVLSGDYYAVYYGGRRMAAAYIGSAERLLTGDEAFERADDEVGIYTVTDVEVDVTDVPGADGSQNAGGAGGSSTASSSASTSSTSSTTTNSADDRATEADTDPADAGIEPIDVTGTDSGPSGITTGTDDPADEFAEPRLDPSSTGITDEDVTAPTESESGDATSRSSSTDTGTDADANAAELTTESLADDRNDDSSESGGPASAVDDRADDASPAESGAEAGAGTEPETKPGTSGSPDPAEVEAAAEQLGKNDISWTEDDVDEAPSAGDADSASGSEQESESKSASAGSSESEPPESELEERFEQEEQWRETRSIPSIDPDNTQPSRSAPAGSGSSTSRRSQQDPGSQGDAQSPSKETASATRTASNTNRAATDTSSSSGSGADRTSSTATAAADAGSERAGQNQRLEQLAERIEGLEEQREALEAKNEELVAERDRLRAENQELSATVDRLESRIGDLETELTDARAGDEDGTGVAAATQLSPDRALAGTNLFVRYESKSQPTLETAHDGDADRDEVAANLQLEHHTEFDAADVAVEGAPYDEFLTSTMAYRFVDWLTDRAIYEIRDTGHASGLADLYDAIPRIDRAELDATISLEDDDTEDVPDQVTFDVVAFDKMGNPLVAATLNDSRQPVTEDALAELEEQASAVKANYPDFAAAMAITSSYFESGAHEVVEQVTSGGFLSRGSKLSYVNLSRKQGYHLCLVESRSEGFHMTVPEL